MFFLTILTACDGSLIGAPIEGGKQIENPKIDPSEFDSSSKMPKTSDKKSEQEEETIFDTLGIEDLDDFFDIDFDEYKF